VQRALLAVRSKRNGFDLHPEVIVDLDEILEFIAADSIAAADRVNDEILDAVAALMPFPYQGHRRVVAPSEKATPLRLGNHSDSTLTCENLE
jgi:plasmid stabilization system protein ParE